MKKHKFSLSNNGWALVFDPEAAKHDWDAEEAIRDNIFVVTPEDFSPKTTKTHELPLQAVFLMGVFLRMCEEKDLFIDACVLPLVDMAGYKEMIEEARAFMEAEETDQSIH